MACTPHPQSCGNLSADPPGRISPLVCQIPTGYTRVCGSHHPVALIKEVRLHRQPCMPFLCPPLAVVLVPDCPPRRLRCVSVVIASAPPRSATKDYLWQTTESTTTLKMVGDSVLP